MVVAPDGAVLQRGLMTVDPVEKPLAMRTVVIAPGADVLVRWVVVPAGSDVQKRAAVLWALRDQLGSPPESLEVALGEAVQGEAQMAVMFDPALRRVWLDYCDALGVTADVLLPDMLAVPAPLSDEEVVAVSFPPNVALRGQGLAATVQPDMVELLTGERRLVVPNIHEDVERLTIQASLRPIVNLIERRSASVGGGWRRVAALAGVLVLTPLILTLAMAARDDLMAKRMQDQTRATLMRTDADLAASSDPRAALERRLMSSPPGGITGVAAALFAAVEAVDGAELDSFTADPEGGGRATVSYPAYEDLDTMKRAVASVGLVMSDQSTVDDAGRVVSEVQIGTAI
ncbi:type II secretion system protein GspL [Brevundimonas vesicularis]|uniref:type II secretion system protein GspL n=1 Tax=Brevundimonas vesicularis TaxID=41276 RepID=UPI0022AC6FF8|nr:type II secretion system protein GspL [Brevundimonas vesicularis]